MGLLSATLRQSMSSGAKETVAKMQSSSELGLVAVLVLPTAVRIDPRGTALAH